ncbi:MAG: NADH-quinone oxidoreductase subunit A [Phycisphaerales bacterium]|nr:NADH-quinone oxidoreductase subunit A [Phycisphaerales bacterium]MCB9856156.1 NADH-quinone oxidoreductase subunit A [Phycisphaerales bacterium]
MDRPGLALIVGLIIFIIAGICMALVALVIGKFLRTSLPHPEKDAAYECGEPTIGNSWVQFDLRFYVVALVFLIFDIEMALFYPWAVVYKDAGIAGLWDMLFFFAVLVVGFAYLWKFGYLDWVRATHGQRPSNRKISADDAMGRAARGWQ